MIGVVIFIYCNENEITIGINEFDMDINYMNRYIKTKK